MSAVALPHVPSARAPSSSASSTRQSLHSASSTVSSKSLRQSLDDDELEEDDGREEEEDDEDDEPHESSYSSHGSGGLWDQVENFLNKPSPSFAALANETKSSSGSVLPTIRHGDRKPQPVAPPGGSGNQSGGPRAARSSVRVSISTKQSLVGTKALDAKLLQEAFAYAEKIQRVSLSDDDDEQDAIDQQREAVRRSVGVLRRDASFGAGVSGSGPRLLAHDKQSSTRTSLRTKADDKPKKKKTTTPSAYGVSVKPHGSKKKTAGSERRPSVSTKDASGWDASADPSTGDGITQSRRGSSASMDQQTIQSLVSTLQNGSALDELRRELAESQQSLAMSRQVIQDAAKSFFRK